MKNILIISYSPLHSDPRIQRQIEAFDGLYNVETVGWTNPQAIAVKRHFAVDRDMPCKNLWEKIQKAFRILFSPRRKEIDNMLCIESLLSNDYSVPDMIVANDWNGLYAAARLKESKHWQSKIYFDAHEYSPAEFNSLLWIVFFKPFVSYTFKTYRKEIAVMSTVCESLARMYEKYFGFEDGFVKVVTNAPKYEAGLVPKEIYGGGVIKLIHHGGAMRFRKLENMIDIMAYLPSEKYDLYLMLVPSDKRYYEELVARASEYDNIKFIPPVDFAKIPEFINKFDIGVYILDNKLINAKYALPNKFFEFVQARLMVAVGDSFEMKSYIKKYDVGICASENTAESMAIELKKLTEKDIMRYKQNAHVLAQKLSSEASIETLCEIAKKLTA